MSASEVIARVDAFAAKAKELSGKGRVLSAAENYRRAADAARALGADNLVTVHLELKRANALINFVACAPDGVDVMGSLVLHCVQCHALLSGAVEAVERRRAADTLLDGKCTAAEEAWRAGEIRQNSSQLPAAFAAALATQFAPLLGYSVFLHSATIILEAFQHGALYFVCSFEQFQAFAQHAVHATELMQQPRRLGDSAVPFETELTKALRHAVVHGPGKRLDARLVRLLAAALQRLERSGVLQARNIEACIQEDAPKTLAHTATLRKSLAEQGMRNFALAACGAKEAHQKLFKMCAGCKAVVYCSKEHQEDDWPSHKTACKVARIAAAADDDGAGPSGGA